LTGGLEAVLVGDREIDAGGLLGTGSYAVVLSVDASSG